MAEEAKKPEVEVSTIDVTVNWEGQPAVVTVGKMKWKDQKNMVNYAVGKVRVLGGETPQVELDLPKLKESVVIYSIKKAPFEVNVDNIGKLELADFNALYTAADKLNPFQGVF